MSKFIRADLLLKSKGIVSSREKAKDAIESGLVLLSGKTVFKPSTLVDENATVKIINKQEHVSRGGKKLDWAIKTFHVKPTGKIAVDVGASTGGFTDCLLKHGVLKVAAIDVGYGQLDWKLRNNPKVSVFERTNIKNLTSEQLGDRPSIAVIDVSFISLLKVIVPVIALLHEDYEIIALIKPQFEAGKENVGKGGIVRIPEVHEDVLQTIYNSLTKQKICVCDATYSPIKGAGGNIEYFFYLMREGSCKSKISKEKIKELVQTAHGSVMKR